MAFRFAMRYAATKVSALTSRGTVFPTPAQGTIEAIIVLASVGLAMSRKPNAYPRLWGKASSTLWLEPNTVFEDGNRDLRAVLRLLPR